MYKGCFPQQSRYKAKPKQEKHPRNTSIPINRDYGPGFCFFNANRPYNKYGTIFYTSEEYKCVVCKKFWGIGLQICCYCYGYVGKLLPAVFTKILHFACGQKVFVSYSNSALSTLQKQC